MEIGTGKKIISILIALAMVLSAIIIVSSEYKGQSTYSGTFPSRNSVPQQGLNKSFYKQSNQETNYKSELTSYSRFPQSQGNLLNATANSFAYISKSFSPLINENKLSLYKVTLTESGLPNGLNWSVLIDKGIPIVCIVLYNFSNFLCYSNNSFSTTMTALLPNGTYFYTAGPYPSYVSSGMFNVSGSPVNLQIEIPKLCSVTFKETSLKLNSDWNVIAISNQSTPYSGILIGKSTSDSIEGYLPSGTYNIYAGPLNTFVQVKPLNLTNSNSPYTDTLSLPTFYNITLSSSGVNKGFNWIALAQGSSSSTYVLYVNNSRNPSHIACLPSGNYSLIATEYSPQTSVISTNAIITGFAVSDSSFTFHLKFLKLYIITFKDQNLSNGTQWFIDIYNNTTSGLDFNYTYSSVITGYFPNGTFFYQACSSYLTAKGSFNVSGSPKSVIVSFPFTYKVTFNELNLVSGVQWEVKVNNQNLSIQTSDASINNTIIVYLPNGTYYYCPSVGGEANTYSSVGETHYYLLKGEFNVSGQGQNLDVNFPTLYHVTLNSRNVPAGVLWDLKVSNDSLGIYYTNETVGNPLIAYLEEGTYNFVAGAGNENTNILYGNITVSASSNSFVIDFPTLYTINFRPYNINPYSYWVLYAYSTGTSLNQVCYSNNSVGSSMVAYLPNGTYNYTATILTDQVTTIGPIQFYVNGTSTQINVIFPQYFQVKFIESNLPDNLTWFVEFNMSKHNGQGFNYETFSSSGKDLTVSLINGTYCYYAFWENVNVQFKKANLTVSGSALNITIVFPHLYKASFVEKNLPAGTYWTITDSSVALGITSYLATTSSNQSEYLPNGTYNYSAFLDYASLTDRSFTINSANLDIYVVFPVTYFVYIHPGDLPRGLTWYLYVMNATTNGNIYSLQSTSSMLNISLINGSYYYVVVAEIQLSSYFTGNIDFNVSGQNLQLYVPIPRISRVTFTETGMTLGLSWYVGVYNYTDHHAIYFSNASKGGDMLFYAFNGSYYYTVSSISPGWKPVAANGSFNVTGSNMTINFEFISTLITVTFKETGLPPGDTWSMTFNKTLLHSTTDTIVASVPNGTYAYSVVTPDEVSTGIRYVDFSPSGFANVSGSNLTILVKFEAQYYLVMKSSPSSGGTVSPNSEWLNASTVLTINAIPGTGYSFSDWVGQGSGSYSGTSHNATIVINGPINETGVFVMAMYEITFNESGLPPGTPWYMNISGMQPSGAIYSSSYSIYAGNGTYSYSVSNLTYYYTTDFSGMVTIAGHNVSIGIQFEHYAYITGTLSPDNASLSVNGRQIKIGNQGSFNISVEAGNFTIFSSAKGYNNYTVNFSLSPGQTKNIDIRLTPSVRNSGSLSAIEPYEIIGVIAALALIGSVIVVVNRRRKK
jgi:hypothetical protein